jgi:hypothetical protein
LSDVVRWPWVETVYAFAMLVDAERIERLMADVRLLHQAELNALGYHDPRRLWNQHRHAMAALTVGPQPRLTMDQVREKAKQLEAIAEAHRMKSEPLLKS